VTPPQTNCEPAASVVQALGGATAVARLCNVHPTQVHRWRRPKSIGGSDGVIPLQHHRKIVTTARERGIDFVTPEYLWPREVAETAA